MESRFSGYFLINGGCKDAYRLKLTCIEFYYHEDDGNIKDEKKYLKGKEEFGYALGAVCPNPSGVDVLFDDPPISHWLIMSGSMPSTTSLLTVA